MLAMPRQVQRMRLEPMARSLRRIEALAIIVCPSELADPKVRSLECAHLGRLGSADLALPFDRSIDALLLV
jgi:hypothetical protein